MIRSTLIPLAFFFLASCQPKVDGDVVTGDSTSGEPASVLPEEEQTTTIKDTDSLQIVSDSSVYIGDIDVFDATREYYTTVYYSADVPGSDNYDYLTGQADSVVYEDDEMRRKRVPSAIAEQYFNLAGLETISVFNDGKHVSDAELVRVELLEGMIESQFIAVFKPVDPSKFSSEVSYCISSGDLQAKRIDISWQAMDDSIFTKELLNTFRLDPKPWHSVQIKAMPYDATYSGITYQLKAYLIETHNGKSTILKEINEDYYIAAIIPIHLEINGKPILLLRMGVNETDMMWTSLAIFSGEQYQFLEGNRLKGKVYL